MVLPTTFSLEVGKDADHQVKASARIRFQNPDLDPVRLDEPHRGTTRIPVNVRIVKLLPAVKLLRIDDNKQFR